MPQPIRIAVLNPSAAIGGAEISFLEAAARLRDDFEFHLIVPATGTLSGRAEQLGINVATLQWPEALLSTGERNKRVGTWKLATVAVQIPALTRRLSSLIERIAPAALVTNGIKCHVLSAVTSLPDGLRRIWYLREGLDDRPMSKRLLSLLSSRCDSAICISRYIAQQTAAEVNPRLRTEIVYNIVDLGQFRPGLPLPDDMAKASGEKWVGIVGALTALKGQDIFLNGAALVALRFPNARFVIVGSNTYDTEGRDFEEQLRRQAAELGLADRVRFAGFRADVAAIVSNLDVLVMANRGPEGLGRTALEAMACGVPVVAPNRWGPAELVKDDETGFTFPPEDTNALAEAITELLSDDALHQRMGQNARRWMESCMSPASLAARLGEVLLRFSAADTARSRRMNA